jgi:hypothetical protein
MGQQQLHVKEVDQGELSWAPPPSIAKAPMKWNPPPPRILQYKFIFYWFWESLKCNMECVYSTSVSTSYDYVCIIYVVEIEYKIEFTYSMHNSYTIPY